MRKSFFPGSFGILMSLAAVSAVAAQTTVPAPTFYPPPGTYQSRLQVSIFGTAATTLPPFGTQGYYTTDGSTPTLTHGNPYFGAITVNASETIKAIVFTSNNQVSPVSSASYVINLPAESALPAGEWTPEGPSSSSSVSCGGPGSGGNPGNYGKMGVPSASNIPGSRVGGFNWTDDNGNLWLFGGSGYDSVTCGAERNDLWMFDISTREWTWMGGSSTPTQVQLSTGIFGDPGVYGTLGLFAAANVPGSRDHGVTWTDHSRNFWLMGGEGFDASGTFGALNDVWEYKPSAHQWAWMAGSKYVNQGAYFNSFGVFHSGNTPGARYGAVSFTDSSGNLWLFGGYGYDAVSTEGYLCDLWEFNPSTRQWAWMGGSHYANQPGTYNRLGVPSLGGHPGGREGQMGWVGSDGNFWLFGGYGYPGWGGGPVAMNDLWEFNPGTLHWTWISGYQNPGTYGSPTTGYQVFNIFGQQGVYGELTVPDPGNSPGGRGNGSTWTDRDGNLWLYGGEGYDAVGTGGYLNDMWSSSLPPASGPGWAAKTWPTALVTTPVLTPALWPEPAVGRTSPAISGSSPEATFLVLTTSS
jgi:N-acetylneuraminic acid mutarotase